MIENMAEVPEQELAGDPATMIDPTVLGREVAERHRRGLKRKRQRDLTAEKYLVMTDGENDGQWAEIIQGQAVIVPPRLGGSLRLQRNLLRPMVDNFVAYLTAVPFRVVAEVPPGRKAREQARLTTALANHFIQTQRLNSLLAEAMYVAAVYGHCPVHATWRVDYTKEAYRPMGLPPEQPGIQPGYVDFWVGDPWATVYDEGATRNSVHRVSYDRTLPLDQVKLAFPEFADRLKGSDKLPSASRFQRIMRSWQYANQFVRGSATTDSAEAKMEQISIVCEETAPGIDPEWPDGRLCIVAMSGTSDIDSQGPVGSSTDAILLHCGPLPAGRFSMVNFYALHRYDDAHGKAYVADLADLQYELNQIATYRAERLRKYSDPQLMAKAGAIDEDTAVGDPDEIMWVNSHEYPVYLAPPQGNPDYDALVRDIEAQMFRIGGWQAASRGESNAGDPAAKVVALSKADDTVFGPISRSFQDSLVRLVQLGVALYREFSDVPTMIQISGEEISYTVEPWIRSEDIPVEDPLFRVTSGFGSSPDALAQNLMNLVSMTGADGQPLLSTQEFWERHPDPSLKPHRPNPVALKQRRLSAINSYIETLCKEAEQEFGDEVRNDQQMVLQLAQFIEQQVMTVFPILRTDEPQMAIVNLDELVQDTTSSALVRMVAELRQKKYFEWLAQIMAEQTGPVAERPEPPKPRRGGNQGTPHQSSPFGGSPTSEALARAPAEVDKLTEAAANAG